MCTTLYAVSSLPNLILVVQLVGWFIHPHPPFPLPSLDVSTRFSRIPFLPPPYPQCLAGTMEMEYY